MCTTGSNSTPQIVCSPSPGTKMLLLERWEFFDGAGVLRGPVSSAQLRIGFKDGRIERHTLVRHPLLLRSPWHSRWRQTFHIMSPRTLCNDLAVGGLATRTPLKRS